MTAIEHPNAKGQTLNMRVEGMDCGACALKIENALMRLPGVSDINVNYGTEMLVLNHDADRISRQVIEDKIRDLGYTPRPAAAENATPTRSGEQDDRPWWKTRKGRLVLVTAGLLTVAVDLYDGVVTTDPAEAGKLMSQLDPAAALAKIKTVLEQLRASGEVTKVGVTGFCMGGVFTLLTACQNQVEAAVPFYGIPDDLSCLANLSCPVLFFGGEKDQWITVEKMDRLREALAQAGKDGEVKVYAGADHAFFNDTRPEVYSAADAADAWQRMLAFFQQQLQ